MTYRWEPKKWIRRWLGLRDTHYMKCEEMKIYGELLEVTSPCEIKAGDDIEINRMLLRVEAHVLRVTKLEDNRHPKNIYDEWGVPGDVQNRINQRSGK